MSDFIHEQADTGLGYTVDKKIVGIIQAFNRLPGLYSYCSCECSKQGQIWIEFEADRGYSERLFRHLQAYESPVPWAWEFWAREKSERVVEIINQNSKLVWKVGHGNLLFDQIDPKVIEEAFAVIAAKMEVEN